MLGLELHAVAELELREPERLVAQRAVRGVVHFDPHPLDVPFALAVGVRAVLELELDSARRGGAPRGVPGSG